MLSEANATDFKKIARLLAKAEILAENIAGRGHPNVGDWPEFDDGRSLAQKLSELRKAYSRRLPMVTL